MKHRCDFSGVRDWVTGAERILLVLACVTAAPFVSGQGSCGGPPTPPPPPPDTREDCASSDPHRQPFFGDLHAHTSSSLDADLQGTRLGPDGAYDFAKGATVDIQPFDEQGNGLRQLTIDRPLDFAMVADHAEFFGEISICRNEENATPGSMCDFYQTFPDAAFFLFNIGLSASPASIQTSPYQGHNPEVCGPDGQLCIDESITLWDEIQDAAENAYDRTSACSFTSFVGYEWTGSPGAQNLHRNVVFKTATAPNHATSYFDAPYVESLWDALESDCQTPGCEFLTIPHNPNMSSGTYFDLIDRNGDPYSEELAARRRRHEPLVEVMQHKGQSECIPESSPSDELCNFEVLPFSTLAGPGIAGGGPPKPRDFVRPVLTEGVKLQRSLGENPFKYGMIGSTDTHLATPGAVAEDNYPGHGGAGSPARDAVPPGLTDKWYYNPGGLAVIWAEENSRDSLFEAMERKEVYATSGSRPVVRFFGGVDIDVNLCSSPTMIDDAYSQGVPMGSDLGPPHPYNMFDPPRFLINVQKDPTGADLQHVQIVKVMVFGDGSTHESVYDVAGNPENGASVDLNTCAPQGAGSSELCTVWTDPFWNPDVQAFYYVRVLENPTCRWHKRQCNAGGVDCANPQTIGPGFEACCSGVVPDTIQERAWTSPIWFTPDYPRPPEVLQPGDVVALLFGSGPEYGNEQIVRMSADGSNAETIFTFPPEFPLYIHEIVVTGPNTILALHSANPGSLLEIDLVSQTVTVVGTIPKGGPWLALEANGDVLVSLQDSGENRIDRLDVSSGTVNPVWTDPTASMFLMDLTVLPDGDVVVARQVNGGYYELVRVDLTTGQETFLLSLPGFGPNTRIEYDHLDGQILVMHLGVLKLDPDTLQVTTLAQTSDFHTDAQGQRTGLATTHVLGVVASIWQQDLSNGTTSTFYEPPTNWSVTAVEVLHPACSDGIDNSLYYPGWDYPNSSLCANQLDNHEVPY